MTNRVSYAPQDFARMCEQAERDHEMRRLVVLMERVKRQIAERQNAGLAVGSPKRPVPVTSDSRFTVAHSRPAPFER